MFLNEIKLREVCGEMLADLDEVLSWKWDRSFQALLSEFPSDQQAVVRSILEKHLKRVDDKKSFRKAPEFLRNQTGLFGDLRSRQLLFSSDPESGAFAFAAWWPWHDQDRISIRIASPDPEAEPLKRPGIFSKIIDFIID